VGVKTVTQFDNDIKNPLNLFHKVPRYKWVSAPTTPTLASISSLLGLVMANILLLDDNPITQKALAGILSRAEHKFAATNTVEEAFRFILENVEVDLLIMEARLQRSPGQPLNMLRLIRSNRFFKSLPVLMYTSVTSRDVVKTALTLHVQNYLIKPYSDSKIFTEISRAQEWGWINGHFDDPRSFCTQMGLTMESWKLLLEDMLHQLQEIEPCLKLVLEKRDLGPCEEKIMTLLKSSEACGFWTLYDLVNDLVSAAEKQQWMRVHTAVGNIAIADKFVMHMLSPDRFPQGFVDADHFGVEFVERDPNSWLADDIMLRCPMAEVSQVMAKLGTLRSFPVGENKAAAFRLAADGHGPSVQAVTEITGNDPCLGALLVQAVNRMIVDHDSMVEDSLQAVQLLGAGSLHNAAMEMSTIPEQRFDLLPTVNWHRFWMYQYGCAQVCAFICEFMEISIFMPHAYWAGMYHDLGKVALAAVYPESFTAASKMAHEQEISMSEAYMKLIGCTSEEAGAHLAETFGFPAWIVNVMRHIRNPQDAVEDRELTAIVSFASALCVRYHVGANGDTFPPADLNLSEFPGWDIIRERVFPSFDISRFGDVMEQWSLEQVLRMSGRDSYVPD